MKCEVVNLKSVVVTACAWMRLNLFICMHWCSQIPLQLNVCTSLASSHHVFLCLSSWLNGQSPVLSGQLHLAGQWSDIVSNWAEGLEGRLYKLYTVVAGLARQQILFFSVIPCLGARWSQILSHSPFFTLVFVHSVGGVWHDWKCVFILVFNVFVLLHASAPVYQLTTVCCGSVFVSCSSFKC